MKGGFYIACWISGELFIPDPSGPTLVDEANCHTGPGVDKNQSTTYEFTNVALAKSKLPKRGYCYLYHCMFPRLLTICTQTWFGCVPNVSY